MKANEAPEKFYYAPYGDIRENHPITDNDIEYIHTDAFIKKFECWMNENFYQYAGEYAEGILAQFDRTEDAIDSFKNYMKGE